MKTLDHKLALEIVEALQARGHIAYLVGGCVRDQLLGNEPKDYDVVTSASPDEMEQWFRKTVAVGKSFGTLTVVDGASQVQVSTLRNCDENAQLPFTPETVSRLLRNDACDRDFTVNAMYLDPSTQALIDFNNGQADLNARLLRTVGDPRTRFMKDRLRLLRAIRFASCYGFTIVPETYSEVANLSAEIATVSPERIRDELKKILVGKDPVRGLDLMADCNLMAHILPEVIELQGPKGMQDPVWHPEGNVWVHSRLVVDQLKGGSFELVLGGLLHDIAKPDTQLIHEDGRISNYGHAEVGAKKAKVICTRLKLSAEETDRVTTLVAMHMKMHDVLGLRPGKLATLLERSDIQDLIALQHADSMGTTCECRMDKSRKNFLEEKLLQHRSAREITPFKPVITGQTLIELGFAPGPIFRQILEEAACAQREGAFCDDNSARDWLQDRFAIDNTVSGTVKLRE